MTIATVTEFKANVSSYLLQVEAGEDVLITNHGRVSARESPECVSLVDGVEFARKASALRERFARTLPKDDWTVKDYINHGRR